MTKEQKYKCKYCEDTQREPKDMAQYKGELCHICRPEPAHLAGFPLGEVSNEFAREWFMEREDY